MGKIYPIQMPPLPLVLAAFTILLICPFATSTTITTSSKYEIECDSCTPVVVPSPPPPPHPEVIACPPPPAPPSFLPPQQPACPACQIPACNLCPPQCPGCPPPPCNVCQMPSYPGGAVYSPPNQVYPYLTPPSDHSAATATSKHLELNNLLVVSIIGLLLSVTFGFF